jgi:uncharacterized protein (DUF2384 family)
MEFINFKMVNSKLKKLHKYGREVLGQNDYQQWLTHKNPFLEGKRPMDILYTEKGLETVERMLGRIEHGIIS